jgi:regulator of sirC expression with transglutaminase-like and TPR domain
MKALAIKPPAGGLSETQRVALVSLLGDEDSSIYQLVRDKLLACGPSACDWLRPHLLSPDPLMRRRALEIVHSLGRKNSDERFLDFCLHHGEDLDLEKALGLLAQTQYPDINCEGYQALCDLWAEDLHLAIVGLSDPEEILSTFNDYLFKNLGFTGLEGAGNNPENCYFNRVIDRRTGNAISLCVIYLLLARRLNLPVTGVALPGHFICRFQSPTREIYIDVFRGGKFWTKADCIRHLLMTHHGVRDGYLTPISHRRIILRICALLHQTYAHLEMAEEAARIQRYLVALAK